MPSSLAATIYTGAILWLFYNDWREQRKTNSAIWIPLTYFFLLASRPVSMWLGLQSPATAAQVTDGSPVDRLVYATLQALAVLVLLGRTARVRQIVRGQAPLLIYLSYCLVSILWSDFPLVAAKRYVKLLTDVLMVLVVVTDKNPQGAIIDFLKRPVFVLIPLSVLFIKYFPHLGREYSFWTGEVLYCGAAYNKNLLGALCMFWGMGYVWLLSECLTGRPRRATTVLPVVGMVAAIWWTLSMSGSATSLSCFLMGAFLVVWTRLGAIRRQPLLVHLPVAGMVASAALVLFGGMGAWVFQSLQRDETLTGRTELWERIFTMTLNPLGGAGFESFWLGERLEYLWSIYWWRPNQAHNGYIELYINLGWLGLAAFLLFLFSAYSQSMKSLRAGDRYASLRLAWVLVSVIYNFTEASFRMQNLAWIFLLFAAVGMPRPRPRANRFARPEPVGQAAVVRPAPVAVPQIRYTEVSRCRATAVLATGPA